MARDTHGSVVKATSVVKNGERVAIFKDPKADSKKKSAKGLLKIERIDGQQTLFYDVSKEQQAEGVLEVVFHDGKLVKETSLAQIRAIIDAQI